ncbi:hypothetical protein ACP4OV_023108 [Aristida adscensionis]
MDSGFAVWALPNQHNSPPPPPSRAAASAPHVRRLRPPTRPPLPCRAVAQPPNPPPLPTRKATSTLLHCRAAPHAVCSTETEADVAAKAVDATVKTEAARRAMGGRARRAGQRKRERRAGWRPEQRRAVSSTGEARRHVRGSAMGAAMALCDGRRRRRLSATGDDSAPRLRCPRDERGNGHDDSRRASPSPTTIALSHTTAFETHSSHIVVHSTLQPPIIVVAQAPICSDLEHATTPDKLTMHDLVHDLARKILDKELIVLDASEQIMFSRFEQHYSRHMRLVNYQKQSKALKEVPDKIRSLHFTECHALQLQQKPFSKYKYLRVLDPSGCSIEGEPTPSNILLPCYIPQLILLRYLDASGLPITSLQKSLSKLQKMQTLILSNCILETLPDDIGSLLNLGYLDLSGNSNLSKLPASIGKLSVLSFLKLSGCSKLEELPEPIHQLEYLRHLDTSGCCALQKLPDMFGSLPKLQFLNLSGCSNLIKLPENLNLESLENLNLSSCHELQNLPQEFGNLDKLVFLNLSDCYKIQALPDSFCRLKSLKDLDLSDCHDLRELPGCFGNLSELQSLNLTSCSKLQSLPDSFSDLSKLKHLNLSYCVRIKYLPALFGKLTLQVLDISACQNLSDLPDNSICSMTSLTQLRINAHTHYKACNQANIIFVLHLKMTGTTIHLVHETKSGHCSIVELGKSISQNLTIRNLKHVKCPEDAERAKLHDYPELRRLTLDIEEPHVLWMNAEEYAKKDQMVLENLVPPRTVEEFALLHYRSKDFPNWILDISSYLPYLVSIQLLNLPACDSLPPFGRLPNLRLLHLRGLPGIRRIGKEFYGEQGTCKKLRIIQLDSLENLDE